MLPQYQKGLTSLSNDTKKVFLCAEGFEQRGLYWISNQKKENIFSECIICRYARAKNALSEELDSEIRERCDGNLEVLNYNRFVPTEFELLFSDKCSELMKYEEIVIDISVMSKLLIMIIINCLKTYAGNLILVYSEPEDWSPTEQEYLDAMKDRVEGECVGLSSIGIYDVTRTPQLSSVVMQGEPSILIAFLSFNEQLIKTLLNSISPVQAYFFSIKNERIPWRQSGLLRIHEDVVESYAKYNLKSDNELIRSYEISNYQSVFEELCKIYRSHCYTKRIILSPTGSKMHAVACSILKAICTDVHIEYPAPKSYLFDSYTSAQVHEVYTIRFNNFEQLLKDVEKSYSLDG